MTTKLFLLAATVLVALGMQPESNLPGQQALEETTYAILVHASNDYSGSPAEVRDTIKQLYLKNRRDWPGRGGARAKALARIDGSDEQEALLTEILDMSKSDLEKHWIAIKQRTGQTRPNIVRSNTMLIKFVKKYEGAFCIVTEQVAKKAGKGVKVLLTFKK